MMIVTRDNLGIQPKFESDKYQDSVLIKHDSYKGRTTQGIVKYLGPGVSGDITEGDYVFYGPYDGTIWYWKGETILIIPEDRIISKLVNIPYTGITGLYCREKLDRQRNHDKLKGLLEEFKATVPMPALDYSEGFAEFLSDKVDSYGAYFEAPYQYCIEQIASTFQEAEWNRQILVAGEVRPFNHELYKNDVRICEYCGGKLDLLRNRTTTRVFYRCENCGKIKDRKTIHTEV